MEQDRAPPVQLHLDQLARQAPHSHEVIINLISNTTTSTGLKVYAQLDDREYEKGIKVSDEQLATINISRNPFHGDWNYTMAPSHAKS